MQKKQELKRGFTTEEQVRERAKEHRLVLDLRETNLRVKLEVDTRCVLGVNTLMNQISLGFFSSIDVKNAFPSMPINPQKRKFLCVPCRGPQL